MTIGLCNIGIPASGNGHKRLESCSAEMLVVMHTDPRVSDSQSGASSPARGYLQLQRKPSRVVSMLAKEGKIKGPFPDNNPPSAATKTAECCIFTPVKKSESELF